MGRKPAKLDRDACSRINATDKASIANASESVVCVTAHPTVSMNKLIH